jgi:hypothetical protein
MIGLNRPLAAGLLLAWTACSLGPAAAQGQAPPLTAASNPADQPAPPPPDPHAVAVDTLEAPHPDSMGLVSAAAGGFADTLWRGTPAVTAQTLVSNLPRRYAAPAARRLAVKFLLSAAPVEGAANAGAMLETRIMALAAMAAWDDALALMDFVPLEMRTPLLAKTRVAGLLAKGRIDAACGEGMNAQDQSDATWAKLQVLCQLVSGQNSGASLGLALMREQGAEEKVFLWAADVAQGNAQAADSPPAEFVRAAANGTLEPVVLALLRKAGYLLPKAVVDAADPTTLMFAAQAAAAPPPPAPPPEPEAAPVKGKGKAKKAAPPPKPRDTTELRLYTIERAADVGVIDAEAVRTAYAAVNLADADTASSTDSIAIDTARQRAATYQLAVAQSVVGSRAEVVARVMDLARLKPVLPSPTLTALIYAPVVMGLPVSPDLAWFAGTAVRVLAAADSAAPTPVADSSARPWLELMQGQAVTLPGKEAAANFSSVLPYTRLTRPGSAPITPEDFAAWQVTLPADPVRALELRVTALDLLTAVGDGLPAGDMQAAVAAQPAGDSVASGPAPSSLLWNAIGQAERAGRVGEVTALALRFLGADAGRPAPIAVTKALESLSIAGRGADARAIAVELALDRGL